MRKFVILIAFLLIAIIIGLFFWFNQATAPKSEVPEVSYQEVSGIRNQESEERDIDQDDEASPDSSMTGGNVEEVPSIDSSQLLESESGADDQAIDDPSLPTEINLAVPFTPQAPFANWDFTHEEACEEASMYMVALYYQGVSGLIDSGVADDSIWEIVNFEKDYFGFFEDTTAAQTVDLLDAFYGLSATVKENPTIEDIKAELAAGRPVILPAAGRKLGNPFFSGEGPLYHMLVLRGYQDNKFITNDPGTWRGESYTYDMDVIMEAMGDWNDGDPANGAKRVIFVMP